MPTNHPDAEIITQIADEAVADHGALTPEEVQTLREFGMHSTESIRDAAKTKLGTAAVDAHRNYSMAVHSEYTNGRRA